MACSFSANQFEREFKPSKLCNWQIPKWHPSRPKQRTNTTKIISNDCGHLLPGISRPQTNPWGNFKGTWQLPDKISRHQAHELGKPRVGGSRWAKPSNKKQEEIITEEKSTIEKNKDLNYIPGDFTHPKHHQENRECILANSCNNQQSIENNCNDLYLEKHNCTDRIALLNEESRKTREIIPHILDINQNSILIDKDYQQHGAANMHVREVTEKPGENPRPPIIPAYCNIQLGKKMAQENLEHQPLPDSIMDKTYRQLQAKGDANPGLALNVLPLATGVGVKTYMAGPTHCTKLRVFRPKTCGVVPRPLDTSKMRPQTSTGEKEKIGAMNLAICWDYRPHNPDDEPKPPKHIDGSNGSVAPAVFTLVKTPRSATADGGQFNENIDGIPNTGRSGGIFSNTLGEENFFDKDILRRNTQFDGKPINNLTRRCICGGNKITSAPIITTHKNDNNYKLRCASAERNKHHQEGSQQIQLTGQQEILQQQQLKRIRCRSSPNLSKIANAPSSSSSNDSGNINSSHSYLMNKENYQLKCDNDHQYRHFADPQHRHHHHHHHHHHKRHNKHNDRYQNQDNKNQQDYDQKNINNQHKSRKLKCGTELRQRLCEQQQQQQQLINSKSPPQHQKPIEYKQAFKAGIPNSNSSGTCTSFDSGCNNSSITSSLTSICSQQNGAIITNGNKVLTIPKPRNPYAKKNYVIDTLAPPFACWHGGAGQGGYPEHWRLASVYQHAYKPVEQRKRPLLATVYQ